MAAAVWHAVPKNLGGSALLRRTVQPVEQRRLSLRLLHTDERYKDLQTKYFDVIQRNADLYTELEATKALLRRNAEKPPAKAVDPKVQIQEKREELYDLMDRHGDPWENVAMLPHFTPYMKPRPDDRIWPIYRGVNIVRKCYLHAGFILAGMTHAYYNRETPKKEDTSGGQKSESGGPSPSLEGSVASPLIMDV